MSQEERARRRAQRAQAGPKRRIPKWLALAVLLVGLVVAASSLIVKRALPKSDPTRFGPARTLSFGTFRVVEPRPGVARLEGRGETNLPDGAQISVEIHTVDTLLTLAATCRGGAFDVALEDTRAMTNGRYTVVARFSLEEQPVAVREALHYQPRTLSASKELPIDGLGSGEELRRELKRLIDVANNAPSRKELLAVADQARDLEQRLCLSTLVPSVRHLRRALAGALSEAKEPDLEALRKQLVEAEVLSSL